MQVVLMAGWETIKAATFMTSTAMAAMAAVHACASTTKALKEDACRQTSNCSTTALSLDGNAVDGKRDELSLSIMWNVMVGI